MWICQSKELVYFLQSFLLRHPFCIIRIYCVVVVSLFATWSISPFILPSGLCVKIMHFHIGFCLLHNQALASLSEYSRDGKVIIFSSKPTQVLFLLSDNVFVIWTRQEGCNSPCKTNLGSPVNIGWCLSFPSQYSRNKMAITFPAKSTKVLFLLSDNVFPFFPIIVATGNLLLFPCPQNQERFLFCYLTMSLSNNTLITLNS